MELVARELRTAIEKKKEKICCISCKSRHVCCILRLHSDGVWDFAINNFYTLESARGCPLTFESTEENLIPLERLDEGQKGHETAWRLQMLRLTGE